MRCVSEPRLSNSETFPKGIIINLQKHANHLGCLSEFLCCSALLTTWERTVSNRILLSNCNAYLWMNFTYLLMKSVFFDTVFLSSLFHFFILTYWWCNNFWRDLTLTWLWLLMWLNFDWTFDVTWLWLSFWCDNLRKDFVIWLRCWLNTFFALFFNQRLYSN